MPLLLFSAKQTCRSCCCSCVRVNVEKNRDYDAMMTGWRDDKTQDDRTFPEFIFTTHFCYRGIAKCPLPPVWAKLTGSIQRWYCQYCLLSPRLGWFEVRNFLVAMKITGRGHRTTDLFRNQYFRTYLKLDVKVPRNCVGPKRFNLSKLNDSVHKSLIQNIQM